MRTAAHVRTANLPYLPVLQLRADVAGEIGRIGILRISDIGDFARQRAQSQIAHALVGELLKSRLAVDETHRDAIWGGEFRRVTVWRRLLLTQWLPKPVNGTFGSFANHGFDIIGANAGAREFNGAIDIGLRHGPAGIGFERDGRHDPFA